MTDERPYGGKYDGMDYKDLALSYRALESEKEELEAQLASVNKEYDFLRKVVVPNKMEQDNLQNVTIKGIGRFTVTADLYTNVPAENRFKLQDWLAERGFAAMIQPTVNGSTLKSFIKEQMVAGNEVPYDLVKIEPYMRASLTKT